MPVESPAKRTCIFVDGQNLSTPDAFGYRDPNYDILKQARLVWILARPSCFR